MIDACVGGGEPSGAMEEGSNHRPVIVYVDCSGMLIEGRSLNNSPAGENISTFSRYSLLEHEA